MVQVSEGPAENFFRPTQLRSKSGGILSTLEVGGLDVLGTPVSGVWVGWGAPYYLVAPKM